ncbi:MAG: hypothetical protein C5B49_06420, partial [Bdellovibrio sp.]
SPPAGAADGGVNGGVNGGVKPLDGVKIESIETYLNPSKNHLDVGLGIWPTNPYWNGFSLEGSYLRYFSKTFAWDVVDAAYVYTVDSGLTSELASTFNREPTQIERINLVLSSNLIFTHAYGKFVFLRESLRYFRSSLYFGPSYINTNLRGTFGFGVGWRFDVYISEGSSIVFALRDLYALNVRNGNNINLFMGSSFGF